MVIRSARIRLLTVDGHPFRGCHVILKGRYFTCTVTCQSSPILLFGTHLYLELSSNPSKHERLT